MADHIIYNCVAYRYCDGIEGVVTDTLASADDDVVAPSATSLGANRTMVGMVAAALDSNDFSGSTSWAAADAGVTGEAFHVWAQGNTGHGGGIYSGAGTRATAGASGTWTSTIGSALPQALASFALYGSQPPEVYDQTKGQGVDAVVVDEPIYGGNFYLILYVQTANEELETPSGWTLVASVGTGTPGAAGATRLTIFAADADASPAMPTLTIVAGGDPELFADGAATLGAVTGAATASAPIAADGAATLGAVTGAATASAPIGSDGAATLGAVTAAATASAPIGADGAATLGAATGSATASAPIAADGAAQLGAVTGAATASSPVHADGAATLGAVTGSGVALVDPTRADGAATLGAVTGAATASTTIAADGSATLGATTGAAAASAPIGSDGAATLGPVAGAATASTPRRADGAAVLGAVTGSASATVVPLGYVPPRNTSAQLATPTITARWE